MFWDIKEQPETILCRPALPMDTPYVIELTSHIWEGEDYVPRVWDQWLADPDGLLTVVESGGKVVGCGKLTKLSEFEWWLEGLRVHPNYEGRGIASHLNNYLLEYWLRIGAGVIRLATGSHRESVKHLSEKAGFKIVAEYTIYKLETIPLRASPLGEFPFNQMKADEIDAAVQFLSSSMKKVLPFGLLNLGWKFGTPIVPHIEKLLEEGQAWWWRKREGLLFLEKIDKGYERTCWILTLACQMGDLEICLSDIEFLVGRMGVDRISWLAPLVPKMEPILMKDNFVRDWESSLLIYEKSYP